MAITERRIMRIKPGKWDEIITLEQQWNKLEETLDYSAPKRWTRSLAGPVSLMNLIWERDWDSISAAEDAYALLFTTPESKALIKNTEECVLDANSEFYTIVEV
jgi:hypothetical protein